MLQKLKVQRIRVVAKRLPRFLCGGREAELSSVFISDEEGDLLQRQRIQQPAGYGSQHRVQISLRTKLARKLDQRRAVIVTIAVKDVALQQFLDPAADRLKDECRKQDQDQERRSGNGG